MTPMLFKYLSIASLLLTLYSTSAGISFAQDSSPEEIEARDFSYKSVKIGSTLESFKKAFPDIKIYADKAGPETASCVIRPTSSRAVIVEFFRDRVYNLKVAIHADEVARIGGSEVLAAKLVKRFGPPNDTLEDGDLNWYFSGIKRDVFFTTAEPEFVLISVTDMPMLTQLEVAKKWPSK